MVEGQRSACSAWCLLLVETRKEIGSRVHNRYKNTHEQRIRVRRLRLQNSDTTDERRTYLKNAYDIISIHTNPYDMSVEGTFLHYFRGIF